MPEIEHIISCEHASHKVPAEYSHLFQQADVLKTHQGWDIGAINVARAMSHHQNTSVYLAEYSRLLIDLNRSLSHPSLFSHYTESLSATDRQKIITEYYSPYRNKILQQMNQFLERSHAVQHISIHSFTPSLQGVSRNCDIGLLYDPSRIEEKHFALRWQELLKAQGLRVRLNYPYRGVSDGFVTYLRKIYSPQRYMGIELEINQSLFESDGKPRGSIVEQIANTFNILSAHANESKNN